MLSVRLFPETQSYRSRKREHRPEPLFRFLHSIIIRFVSHSDRADDQNVPSLSSVNRYSVTARCPAAASDSVSPSF